MPTGQGKVVSGMTCEVDIQLEDGLQCAITEEEITSICGKVLEEEGVRRFCDVSVSVVTDERMRELNLEWRGQDRPTDVISLECERPNDPLLAEGEPCQLGDIVIAPSYIATQAQGFGTTEADETRLLLVHGMLHLLGYDHVEDEEAEVMEAREDELLSLMRTDRDLGGVVLTRHKGEDAP